MFLVYLARPPMIVFMQHLFFFLYLYLTFCCEANLNQILLHFMQHLVLICELCDKMSILDREGGVGECELLFVIYAFHSTLSWNTVNF